MSRRVQPGRSAQLPVLALVVAFLLAGIWHLVFSPTYGAQLGDRSLKLNTSQAGATAEYMLSFSRSSPGTLGSVVAQFCSNDPFPGDSCTTPAGLDVSGAVLSSQTGPGGFSISAATANQLTLSRSPSAAPAGQISFEFTGVTNPSSPGSYFVRLQTFASPDASGPSSNDGGIAFAIANLLAISAEVPPYLIFCTGVTIPGNNCANADGNYIDFGELSPLHASSGSSQMLAATNAQSGYNVTVDGTTMTSGNNVIDALSSGDVSRPGTSQFGFNLRANTTPPGGSNPSGPGAGGPLAAYNQPNVYRFVPGDMIITNGVPDNLRTYTASYITNVPKTQAPGIYVSTLTYVCLASF